MPSVTRISTIAAAALMLAVSPALAQPNTETTALDNVPTPGNPVSGTSADMMMTDEAYGVFYEDDGTTFRSAEDARTAYDALSEEDQALVNTACSDWEEEDVAFLDSVSTTCIEFSDAGQ